MTKKLNAQKQRFVEEYLKDVNATQAAIRAGYTARSAHVRGHKLLQDAEVAAAIKVAQAARSKRTEVTVDRVLTELAAIGFADMGDYLTLDASETTVRLDWSNLPPGATKIIQEITQEEHTGGRGHDTGQVRRTKFKLYSKLDAIDKMMRHLGMFTDKLKIEGSLLDDFSPHELAALVSALRAAGFGGSSRSGDVTRH